MRGYSLKKAQGSTEYLGIMIIVLVIALVSISIMNDAFVKTSDVKVSESSAYWQSASPIAILESRADASGLTFKVRNNGLERIEINGILSSGSQIPLSPAISLSPGEERLISNIAGLNLTAGRKKVDVFSLGFSYTVRFGSMSMTKIQTGPPVTSIVCGDADCSSLGSSSGCGIGCGFGYTCCSYEPGQYACLFASGGTLCSGFEVCSEGKFYCEPMGQCVPLGTICNNCMGSCGEGQVCCVCDAQCVPEGQCACEHCLEIQCSGGNCICVSQG
ncbi:MAG: hypothetical protein N3F07_00890 [Candidatus Micrarchaeota archaeon]|nr:hypothetical protein [Candidatus Micrarchaeota archaeon]